MACRLVNVRRIKRSFNNLRTLFVKQDSWVERFVPHSVLFQPSNVSLTRGRINLDSSGIERFYRERFLD